MENDGPFVSRETYGEEIRETFPQERADHLSARETFGNSADWYDHFTRGRRDWLKSASCTVVGDCTTYVKGKVGGPFLRTPKWTPERAQVVMLFFFIPFLGPQGLY